MADPKDFSGLKFTVDYDFNDDEASLLSSAAAQRMAKDLQDSVARMLASACGAPASVFGTPAQPRAYGSPPPSPFNPSTRRHHWIPTTDTCTDCGITMAQAHRALGGRQSLTCPGPRPDPVSRTPALASHTWGLTDGTYDTCTECRQTRQQVILTGKTCAHALTTAEVLDVIDDLPPV